MKSIKFPDMLRNNGTNIISDHEATYSNLRLTLASIKKSLFGDPYFGTNLKNLIYNQNNIILRDLVIDQIYMAIVDFMPQLIIDRKNIIIKQEKTKLYAEFKCTNLLDYETNLYVINLTEDDPE